VAILFGILLLLFVSDGHARTDATQMTIGVLAGEGEESALAQWSPTAQYLTQRIPEHRFVIVPLDRGRMRRAVVNRELDFVVTDPGQYVELADANGVAALATMTRAWQGKRYAESSVAIIARADRDDIRRLSQVRGKSFIASSRDLFEGFQLVNSELIAHRMEPARDLNLDFRGLGLTPEQIVYAVRDRMVDIAAVRAGVLERMAQEGKIDPSEFHVLHRHSNPGFPFAASTDAYPEWPFARTREAPEKLAQQVAGALRAMPANQPAARAAGYAGWSAPGDYAPVATLEKHVCPYEDPPGDYLAYYADRYRAWLIAGTAALFLLTGFVVYVVRTNRRLKVSKLFLEREVAERTRAEQALRQSEGALRALHDITSRHSLPFEEKARALLELGREQFGMPVAILSRVDGGECMVVEICAPESALPKGAALNLDDALCCDVLQTSEPQSCERVSQPSHHPAFGSRPLGSRLCVRVEAEDTAYGVLNFLSDAPRTTPFSETDKEILKLMAQWLEVEIERQRIEARARKLSSALEQTADMVVITNRDGVIEYVNTAFVTVTGYAKAEAIGKTPGIVRSDRHDEEFYRRLWKTIRRGEAFHDTFINRKKDGALFYEEKTITPLTDAQGNVTHFVSTGKDVTSRRLVEEHSRARQAELAHAGRVNAMGEMTTTLAHELNQPLAAIVNYAQGSIRRVRAGGIKEDELLGALERIAALGSQAGEIIRRLRDFLRKGKPLRERVDINHVVREAADLANLEARRKDVTLRLELSDGLPPVLADPIQIEQVVLNLVHNAIEAIDQGQCPRREVIVQTAPDPKNGVEVIVRDTGPGFAVEDAERLFDTFYTTKATGLGMGLSISRSIIDAHGERLEAMPGAGGAVFRFALPPIDGETLH
jgi:PAS domain S-box-containing protein